MAFFKPSTQHASSQMIARLHAFIWILIYGGLFTLVIGLAVVRSDDGLGWWITGVGVALAVSGAVLVYVRSKIDPHP